jgi:hypothetical protein
VEFDTQKEAYDKAVELTKDTLSPNLFYQAQPIFNLE